MKTEYQKALEVVIEELRKDKGLWEAFQANIAMSFVDSARWYREANNNKRALSRGDIHVIANEAATNFLYLLSDKKRT